MDIPPVIRHRLYAIGQQHILIALLLILGFLYLIETLLHIRWFRWVYSSLMLIIILHFLWVGNNRKAMEDIFKLALV